MFMPFSSRFSKITSAILLYYCDYYYYLLLSPIVLGRAVKWVRGMGKYHWKESITDWRAGAPSKPERARKKRSEAAGRLARLGSRRKTSKEQKTCKKEMLSEHFYEA